MTSTTIQFRTDADTKKKARKVFDAVGLDMSTAFNVFMKKAIAVKGIPFEVRTENGFTPAEEQEIIRETEWTLKHGKRYKDVDEMWIDVLGKEGFKKEIAVKRNK